jgi:hypothetical protein
MDTESSSPACESSSLTRAFTSRVVSALRHNHHHADRRPTKLVLVRQSVDLVDEDLEGDGWVELRRLRRDVSSH